MTAGDDRDMRTRGSHSSVEWPPAVPAVREPRFPRKWPPAVSAVREPRFPRKWPPAVPAVREPRFPRRSLYNAVHGGGKDIELIGTARDCVNRPAGRD